MIAIASDRKESATPEWYDHEMHAEIRWLLRLHKARYGCLSLVGHVHPGDAEQRGLQPVSAGLARRQPGQQLDYLQRLGFAIRPDGWPDLVEYRHCAGHYLLHHHLPPLPGQGHGITKPGVLRLVAPPARCLSAGQREFTLLAQHLFYRKFIFVSYK